MFTVLFIRQGKVLGSRSYFPKVPGGTELGEVVETFVGQFYLQGSQMRTLPSEILLDFNLDVKTLLADRFPSWRAVGSTYKPNPAATGRVI